VCERVELPSDGSLRARFRSARDADWIELVVSPLGAPGPVFRKLSCCQVRYSGQLAARTEQRKAEVLSLVVGLAQAVDARLAARPGASIAEALGRPRRAPPLLFGPKGVRDLLGLDETSPRIAGFRLVDVYPSSNARGASGRSLALVLDFRRDEDAQRALLVVGPRDDRAPAFAHTAHFSLSFLSVGSAEAPGVETLRAYVGFLLQVRDSPGMDVTFPESLDEAAFAPQLAAAGEPAAPDEPAAALNLAIGAECGQSCAFCSVKETWPAEDGGEAELRALASEMRDKRRRGVRKLRVNGYDPLAFSRILDALRLATELGFTEVDVFSPCTRLADEAFCDAVLAALPPASRFYVPLYGATAAVHDVVVGVPGAFDRVMRAIDLLVRKRGRGAVSVLTVLVRKNLPHVAELLAFVRGRDLSFSMHLPYPSFESRGDRFYSAAARQSDVVAALRDAPGSAADGRLLLLEGAAPCVVLAAMKDSGVPIARWLRLPAEKPLLPGTEYRDPRYQHRDEGAAFQARSVPCPHAARCALATVCPGEVLRGYADLYGLGELAPVSLAEVVIATDPRAAGAIREARDARGRGARARERVPETLIDVPSVCDRACVFCHVSQRPLEARAPRGSDAAVEAAIAGLSGPVLFTGDDALSHPRIVEFVEAARRRTAEVSIIGPPRKGKTAALAPALVKAGLARYITALLGPDARSHDAVAGREGAFDALCEAVLVMRSNGVAVELVTPLVRPVLGSLGELLLRGRSLLGASAPLPSLLAYAPDSMVGRAFDAVVPGWDELRTALSGLPPDLLGRVSVDGLPLCVLPEKLRQRAPSRLDRSDGGLSAAYPESPCRDCRSRAACPGVADTVLRAAGAAGLRAL
jgi:MoaA/NifB/PqqE/SkfB family radical SAM enzyme